MRNSSLTLHCLLALAATTPPLMAAGETKPRDDLIPFAPRWFIEVGLTCESVLQMLGQPSAKLSPSVWVYFDVKFANCREIGVHGTRPSKLDTAVVTFANGRVVEIRLCDSKPVRAFLATLERRARAGSLIAAQPSPPSRPSSASPDSAAAP